jgi:hypothetical protein
MLAMILLQGVPVEGFVDRARGLLAEAGGYAMACLLALVVLAVGWALARLAGALVLWLLRVARFNDGMRGLLGPGSGTDRWEPAVLASRLVFATLLALAVVLAADALGMDLANSVGSRLRDVLPRVVAAMIVLGVGSIGAMVLGEVALRLLAGAGVRHARLRGRVVGGVLMGFAVLLALEQLGIAAQLIVALGITAVAAVGFAAALAFGLGCRDLARDFVVEYLRSLDDDSPRAPR